MLAVYPSGTINKFQIPFCDFKTTVFGPLISCSVSPRPRVPWSNVECYHSSFSPKGQIHHPRKWMVSDFESFGLLITILHPYIYYIASKLFVLLISTKFCRSRNSSDDEYRSSRNIAISLLRRYRTVIERGEGETLKVTSLSLASFSLSSQSYIHLSFLFYFILRNSFPLV